MEIIYSDEAQRDIAYWRKSGNVIVQKKIMQLLSAIEENPFLGIGKPEPLKHNLSGLWSRRIIRSIESFISFLKTNKRLKYIL